MFDETFTPNDLPDLSDWAFVPIWTLEEAILLWAGIDPVFSKLHKLHGFRTEQIRRAHIAQKAFTTGIALKTLNVHELYVYRYVSDFETDSIRENQKSSVFSPQDIDIGRTLVQQMVIIEWARRQRIPTMKQTLQQIAKQKDENNQQQAEPLTPTIIQQIPYIPKHDNPELEIANEISREIWDNVELGVRPPKALCTKDKISELYEKKEGVKPIPAIIARIDTIARPPAFKNQGKKEKG